MSSGKKAPDSKVHGANMGPTCVLSAPDEPHVGPMNHAIRGIIWSVGDENNQWCHMALLDHSEFSPSWFWKNSVSFTTIQLFTYRYPHAIISWSFSILYQSPVIYIKLINTCGKHLCYMYGNMVTLRCIRWRTSLFISNSERDDPLGTCWFASNKFMLLSKHLSTNHFPETMML